MKLRNCSVTCTLGLIPFAWLAYQRGSFVGAIVTFNGVLFHMFCRGNRVVKWYDILCNTLLTGYVNLSALSSVVSFFSLLGITGFVVNTMSENSDITHVLGVQLPLAVALYHSGL